MSGLFQTFQTRSIEARFFIFLMICATPYFLLNFTIGYINNWDPVVLIIFLTMSLICIGALYLVFKQIQTHLLISSFTILVLMIVIYYLPSTAGPHGGISYTLQTLIAALILMNKGLFRWIVAVILAGYTIALTGDFFEFPKPIGYLSLLIDYHLNLLLLALTMIYFKRNYDYERKTISDETAKLESLKKELELQTHELESTMTESLELKNNLEQLVELRTKKVEKQHKRRKDYAFATAHLVRAPLSNIMGLTALFPENEGYGEIQNQVTNLDDVVRKMGKAIEN